ncbi:MAG: hypothetical protein UW55_C0044G0003 [Candidatus Giovannonibacteria bacterium GW2011_GWA2_44_26]|uniref:Uncharacterized protein n=1 Tax=Candidatus Giovannonibacteria bacterium GW2011_GWA2_44_26 TaxID=1618648 RepID=A0A0G1INU0_9BACT|nr:MAG: hypothetical protein UW55_C0044G0003 [Candidatus Giovannonibacteria bacterium GW2011_GWA2_44_26]
MFCCGDLGQYFLNEAVSPLNCKASVRVQKLLQFTEITVNGIRGVWNMQCWIFLIGE